MMCEPLGNKDTIEIEKLLLKARISKKLREKLSKLIASHRLLEMKLKKNV